MIVAFQLIIFQNFLRSVMQKVSSMFPGDTIVHLMCET